MAGIYIHIPFCRQACTYCNFHFSTSLTNKDAVVAALAKEITLQKDLKENIDTIYFGGGTPSLLSIDDLQLLFEALGKSFTISNAAEITLEANPDDISPEILKQWRLTGINRLSVGIQSFLEEELIWMNRAHNAAQSLQCIEMISDAGYTNFSVDLIYGSPLLSNDAFKKNAEIIFQKAIPHISCYALTVEPKTALHSLIDQKKSLPVSADKQAEQFLLLMKWMQQAGYEHYEISNFAKPGMRSQHNSSYWKGISYIGIGPSAHSFNGNTRRWNVANNSLYIQSINKNIIPYTEEVLTNTQQLNECIMISLRTMEGLNLKSVKEKFGGEAADKIFSESKKFLTSGAMQLKDERLVLTNEGKLLADGIAADLFL